MTTATRVGRLENKVALITGATGDVGKIVSQRFLAEGATIAITGRDRDELQACRQHLVDAENVPEDRVLTVRMDGSDIAETLSNANAYLGLQRMQDMLSRDLRDAFAS